jgi:hypothetical protein
MSYNFSNSQPTKRQVRQSAGSKQLGVDLVRRRATELRRLAAAARDASDKAFWLGLAER